MKKLIDELKNKNYQVSNISYLNDNIIITCNDKKYLLIPKDNYSEEKIKYLESINCNYYLQEIDSLTDYKVLEYYDSNNSLKDLIITLTDIHTKSLNIITYSDELLKDIYEDKLKEIDEVMKYNFKLQDYIEELYYTRSDYYQMIINISKVYNILCTSRYFLDKWYNSKDNTYREVFLIGNISLNNFISNKNNYFIDLKNSSRGNIVEDLTSLYKEYYNKDIYSLIFLYNSKIPLTEKELYFFLSSISLVPKLKFTSNYQTNLKLINDYYDYIDKTMSFVLEKDKEYQETNKEIFKQKNNNIQFSSDENKN